MQTEKQKMPTGSEKHGFAFYTQGRNAEDLRWNTVPQSSVGSFVADMQGSSGELCGHTPDPGLNSNMCLIEITPRSIMQEDHQIDPTTGVMKHHTISATAFLTMPVNKADARDGVRACDNTWPAR